MTILSRSRQPLLTVLGALLSLLPAARAQVSFDIAPYVGFSVPLRSMFVEKPPVSQPFDQYGTGATVALQKTIAVGTHLTVWPARRFGLEATFGYAPSGVTMGCRSLAGGCNQGHVVTASAKVVVPLSAAGSLRSFYVGAGVGLVDLGGPAYEGLAVATSGAGTVAAGWERKSASAWSVRIEAEDYVFLPHFQENSCSTNWAVCRVIFYGWGQQLQHGVILSIGLVFHSRGPQRYDAR